MILNTGDLWEPEDADIIQWQKTYPAVDVFAELAKMESWLDANPSKRKTSKGIKRFVNSWLSRAQDRGGSSPIQVEGKKTIRQRSNLDDLTDISYLEGAEKQRMRYYFILINTGRHSMASYTTNQQINEIINTDLYKSGKPFTIAEMTEICTSTNYASRMNQLLRYLVDDGYVRSYGNQQNLLYSRAGEKWLKKRWVSEMAENLCDGDYCGNLTGKTSLDVRERTETL
jgi:hypothetical protein